jgi:hypothetical protein
MIHEISKERIEKITINEETGEITIYKDFGGATRGLNYISFKVIDLKIKKLNIPDESPETRIIYRQSSE